MKKIALFLAILFAANAHAEVTYESSLLELKEGFIGETLGVEVEEILFENDQTVIELGFSDLSGEPDNLRLLDSNGDPVAVKKGYELIKDHDNTPKGVILYLDKRHKRAFRIVYELNETH